jgi:ABC-type phosphate/phosphonate transport system substrate-binding protein
MTAIAQLPMYDFPELREATDALWQAVAERLRQAGERDVPETLARDLPDKESWSHPELLLGQSCGYPAMRDYRRYLRIVATPIYEAPGCSGPNHASFILCGAAAAATSLADLRGARFALNARDSNTGMNLPRLAFAALARGGRFFAEVIETGSHAASLALVAGGGAEAAAIDCVTHAHLARHRPALVAGTRILERTAASPALPFVKAQGGEAARVERLRQALAGALADPALAAARAALRLAGIVPAEAADYAVVLDYEEQARRLGYPELR